MDYLVLVLPTTTKKAQELINEYANLGWRVICQIADYKLLLGREKKEEKRDF